MIEYLKDAFCFFTFPACEMIERAHSVEENHCRTKDTKGHNVYRISMDRSRDNEEHESSDRKEGADEVCESTHRFILSQIIHKLSITSVFAYVHVHMRTEVLNKLL